MEVSVQQLLATIGELHVEKNMLAAQVNALAAENADLRGRLEEFEDTEPEKKPSNGAKAKA